MLCAPSRVPQRAINDVPRASNRNILLNLEARARRRRRPLLPRPKSAHRRRCELVPTIQSAQGICSDKRQPASSDHGTTDLAANDATQHALTLRGFAMRLAVTPMVIRHLSLPFGAIRELSQNHRSRQSASGSIGRSAPTRRCIAAQARRPAI
jgi:hypothetical protein